MITEDEVMRLLERADPVRRVDAATAVDAAGYLATLRTRSNNVTLIDTEPNPSETKNRHRRLIITVAAAAAVVAVVVGAIVLVARNDPDDEIPAGPSTTVAPETRAAVETARGFVDAYFSFDPDKALSYLTDNAIAQEWGSAEELRLLNSMLHAQHSSTTITGCEPTVESDSGANIRCAYEHQSLGSEELGLGPFTGGYWDLTVRHGKIVSASSGSTGGPERYSAEVWDPFRRWVERNYPDDVATMYEGSGWRLTEESIRLWEQHVGEYIESGAE